MTTPLLCLACSSSPLPKPGSLAPFTTACCSRPICESCLTKNPRLRGYNPCLACLVGVAVVDKSRAHGKIHAPGPSGQSQEQENNMFILGDSDEEEGDRSELNLVPDTQLPPAYSEESKVSMTVSDDETLVADISAVNEVPTEAEGFNPSRYYIQRDDTLTGISLRYGVDGRTICQLNSLPLSTLSTTPHLLHTRTSLILPHTRLPLPSPPESQILQARTRERAEKRFQFVTKEVDWRVAKAYVSLAEDEDEMTKSEDDPKAIKSLGKRTLEAKAVGRYLDDGDWEASQSRTSRIRGFPPFSVGDAPRRALADNKLN